MIASVSLLSAVMCFTGTTESVKLQLATFSLGKVVGCVEREVPTKCGLSLLATSCSAEQLGCLPT